jgi:hypothetical protein
VCVLIRKNKIYITCIYKDNRHNYAIIDLTKTAEPLPSDSESENEKEKNEANGKK